MVTGPNNTYVYMKQRKEENDTYFTQDHSQINSLEQGRDVSTNFTCHEWSKTSGMILICTDNGEMLLCANNGEYKAYINDAPLGKCIDSIISSDSGFIVCAEDKFMIFKEEDGDERALLRADGASIPIIMKDGQSNSFSNNQRTIKAMTIPEEEEDRLYAITSDGQLITAPILLKGDDEERNDNVKFEYVFAPFHRHEITGLDVCIRKELIATCSRDKTVSVWNYATKQHEISQSFTEECLTLAFHPSGLHLVLAL